MSEHPDGVELIAAERKRQIEVEGWTAEHDDQHVYGQLVSMAAIYALNTTGELGELFRTFWPRDWSDSWWKPSNPIRDLTKAGALIAAEIDRLQRREAAA